MISTQVRNADLRPDKPQACCQHPPPSLTEPGLGWLQSRQSINKLLSISMPQPMSHLSNTVILRGSYVVGQHAASHIKSEHWSQETLLSVWDVVSATLCVPEICHLAVLLDQEAWQNDRASFLSVSELKNTCGEELCCTASATTKYNWPYKTGSAYHSAGNVNCMHTVSYS